MNYADYLFVFRFDERILSASEPYNVEFDVKNETGQIFQFFLGSLHKEDILLDIKDKIINCLKHMKERAPQMRIDDLLN